MVVYVPYSVYDKIEGEATKGKTRGRSRESTLEQRLGRVGNTLRKFGLLMINDKGEEVPNTPLARFIFDDFVEWGASSGFAVAVADAGSSAGEELPPIPLAVQVVFAEFLAMPDSNLAPDFVEAMAPYLPRADEPLGVRALEVRIVAAKQKIERILQNLEVLWKRCRRMAGFEAREDNEPDISVGTSLPKSAQHYLHVIRAEFDATELQQRLFAIDKEFWVDKVRKANKTEAEKHLDSRFTAYMTDEFGGMKCARHYLQTAGTEVRSLKLSPEGIKAKGSRGRRETLDPNEIRPRGQCVLQKRHRWVQNLGARLISPDPEGAKVSKTMDFFRSVLMAQDGVQPEPIPSKYVHLYGVLRRAGLDVPALTPGISAGGQSQGRGRGGGQSQGRGGQSQGEGRGGGQSQGRGGQSQGESRGGGQSKGRGGQSQGKARGGGKRGQSKGRGGQHGVRQGGSHQGGGQFQGKGWRK